MLVCSGITRVEHSLLRSATTRARYPVFGRSSKLHFKRLCQNSSVETAETQSCQSDESEKFDEISSDGIAMDAFGKTELGTAAEYSAARRARKKIRRPGTELRFSLDQCSKFGDVERALAIYDKTKRKGELNLDQYLYNVVLYLCSTAGLGILIPSKSSLRVQSEGIRIEVDGVVLRGHMASLVRRKDTSLSEEVMSIARQRGLQIYAEMQSEGVSPNEASYTALARLAVANYDGDLAFGVVKQMILDKITPRLRSYAPALYTYFKKSNVKKALEVYDHMLENGVQPDEAELEVLLELSSKAELKNEVYDLLHRLRRSVRDVSRSTVEVIARWFRSDAANVASGIEKSATEVHRVMEERGGGWHGLGWLGKGKWQVEYTKLDRDCFCCNCKEKLVTIDIDPQETENFAEGVAKLAFENELNSNSFKDFQRWLDRYGPYDVVVDGANVGMYQQRQGKDMNFQRLDSVVNGVRQRYGKWPLVIMHQKRAMTAKFSARQLLKNWDAANMFYATPTGSNDDWYWLYAAVKCKSLLISNDEMRDHLFSLLGNDFFPKWKERHQIRFHGNRTPYFLDPPPYSVVIQESEYGSWHVPVSDDDGCFPPKEWLCVSPFKSV